MKVGFIGLGLMGSRMAANLVRKGFEVAVYNRTRSRADALGQLGARIANSPREAAEGADVVCTNVADPAAMREVFDGPDGLLAGLGEGAAHVDFSTLSPEVTRNLAARCEQKGASFLESPVTGSKDGAEHGTLVLMCGGEAATFERVRPVLEAVGRRLIHVGPVGSASQVKLIGNSMIGHMLTALSEGAALASRSGIPLSKVLEVVQASGYASPYWDFKGKAIEARDFTTHFSIDLMHKDLSLAMSTGQSLGVPMPGTATVREVFQLARAQGMGDEDICAVAKVIDPSLKN